MRQVAADPNGTAYATFGDYPVAIAAKTGTAETSSDGETDPNLTFIAYAPWMTRSCGGRGDGEREKGAYAQNVAKDILDQYFGFVTRDEDGNRFDSEGNQIDKDGKVLKTADEVAKEKEERRMQRRWKAKPRSSRRNNKKPTLPLQRNLPVLRIGMRGFPTHPFTGESQPVLPESTMPLESSSGSRTKVSPIPPIGGGP